MAENENKELEKTPSSDKNGDVSKDAKKSNDNEDSIIPDEILEAIPAEERGKVIRSHLKSVFLIKS